jgi:peptidoglycan/LPS O-acetylase OafA/YrhL
MAEGHGLLEEDNYELSEAYATDSSDIVSIQDEKVYKKRPFSSRFHFLRRCTLPSLPPSSNGRLGCFHTLGYFFLPSFLHPSQSEETEQKALRRTAALDGLRGLAAFFVLNFHFFGAFINMNGGYVVGDPNFAKVWNLPMIKIFHAGTSMVHIFFAISGYILSLRSLQQMKKHNLEGVMKTLSSSTFRRGARLFGPTTVSMIIEMFAIQLGLFETSRDNLRLIPWELAYFPPREETLRLKFAALRNTVWGLADSFQWGEYHSRDFDVNLWTIGIEFRCSVALFLVILAVCRINKAWIRRLVLVGLTITYITYQRWDFVLFLAGMLLADIDTWSTRTFEEHGESPYQIFWGFIALAGIYFCSSPNGAPDFALGFGYITKLGAMIYYAFPFHFAESVGAICLVAAAMHSIHLRWILETKLVQYLGRISYMLYVVHGPMIRALGLTIVPFVWRVIAKEAPRDSMPYNIGVVIGYIAFVPMAIWIADIYTRLIDDRCVQLARWVENKCIKTD